MTPTELTVTGRRCIERRELAIPPGLALQRVGHDLGVLLRVRNSMCWIPHVQDHLRVIRCRWPLWASSARASSHPGGHIRADRCSEARPQPSGQHPLG